MAIPRIPPGPENAVAEPLVSPFEKEHLGLRQIPAHSRWRTVPGRSRLPIELPVPKSQVGVNA